MHLNLARKWRSKTFDEVIGQDLNVRILKNSLYLGHFFPVYLFSGQRGCGKTTMARIFAAALNCQALPSFQAQPKTHCLPCLTCDSCMAITQGAHPDFIEIDAASHTGVDNVRGIIDSATLLPVLGTKRVYLIDEAHMLSKAAFNAFLKILEDPPAQLHFILATTELTKIIETVRSRSFQLFFGPIGNSVLLDHLQVICIHEAIAFQPDGLQLIIQETQGSVRDALNLLEQARFAGKCVTRELVEQVLGHPPQNALFTCIELIVMGDDVAALTTMRTAIFSLTAPITVWNYLVKCVRDVIALHCHLPLEHFPHHDVFFNTLLSHTSLKQCAEMLAILSSYEGVIIKSGTGFAVIELIVIRLAATTLYKNQKDNTIIAPANSNTLESHTIEAPIAADREHAVPSWQLFMQEIATLNDPLIASIFKQHTRISWDAENSALIIYFSQELTFLNDLLESTRSSWHALFLKVFGSQACLQADFSEQTSPPSSRVARKIAPSAIVNKPTQSVVNTKNSETTQKRFYKKPTRSPEVREEKIDVSDQTVWQKANKLLAQFPGIITVVQEDNKDSQ